MKISAAVTVSGRVRFRPGRARFIHPLLGLLAAAVAVPVWAAQTTKAQRAFTSHRVVQQRACLTCHAVGGTGGTVGPKLDQAGNRRSSEWLRRWLKNPPAVRPGTLMPNFLLSDDEITALVGLLTDLKVDIDAAGILAGGGDDVARGEKLFRAYDCLACHRIGAEGRFIGPDLTWLGNRRTPAWERTWLLGPDRVKPGTFMPDFHLPAEQVDVLVAYLMTLKGQANEEAQTWEMNTAFQLDSRPREVGERIYKRLGCNGCHGVGARNDKSGRDGYTNPNAAPDGMMPAVNRAAEKYSAEAFAALFQTRRAPAKLDPADSDPLPCPAWPGVLDKDEMSSLYAYFQSLLTEP